MLMNNNKINSVKYARNLEIHLFHANNFIRRGNRAVKYYLTKNMQEDFILKPIVSKTSKKDC